MAYSLLGEQTETLRTLLLGLNANTISECTFRDFSLPFR